MVISTLKGWIGEMETQFGMWLKLGDEYIRFHNIIVPTPDGTAQIDHLLLSQFGIFVVETKNMSGWIFGDEKSKEWTQSLYGRKYRFQNPLHQNYRHTKALASYLKIDHEKIHSVVFFIGDTAELKTKLPPNVMAHGLCEYIQNFRKIIFPVSDLNLFQQKILDLKRLNISTEEHVENLKFRHSNDSICPKCGGELKQRQAKRGQFAGNYFLGCSNFPQCKYSKKI